MTDREADRVVVVGAGVCGLACARALTSQGRRVVVLERARGVGGRCATRRLEGQPLDFGVSFLHASDPELLAALEAVPASLLAGWPQQILGTGRPCQPEAFSPRHRRLAYAEGVSAFPRHLADGLEVRLEARVTALEDRGASLRLALDGAEAIEAPTVVLALATEQVRDLLATLGEPSRSIRAATALLEMDRSDACLSLLAAYAPGTAAPAWHVAYPETSTILQLASNESSKRTAPPFPTMVYQAHAAWSRPRLEDPGWPQQLLAEAGRLFGPWAASPRATHPHRWRYARHDRSAELAGPMLIALGGGARVAVCGDRFAPGVGVEAAWRSGRLTAAKILAEGDR